MKLLPDSNSLEHGYRTTNVSQSLHEPLVLGHGSHIVLHLHLEQGLGINSQRSLK